MSRQLPWFTSPGSLIALFGATAFLGAIAVLAAMGRLSWFLFGWYVVVSFLTYHAYAADKVAAQRSAWRESNMRLHFVGIVGGWPGAWVAQQAWKNKNRQPVFQVLLVLTICAHVALIVQLASLRL